MFNQTQKIKKKLVTFSVDKNVFETLNKPPTKI